MENQNKPLLTKLVPGIIINLGGAGLFLVGAFIRVSAYAPGQEVFFKDIGETVMICGAITVAMTTTAMIATIIYVKKLTKKQETQKEIVSLNEKTQEPFLNHKVYR